MAASQEEGLWRVVADSFDLNYEDEGKGGEHTISIHKTRRGAIEHLAELFEDDESDIKTFFDEAFAMKGGIEQWWETPAACRKLPVKKKAPMGGASGSVTIDPEAKLPSAISLSADDMHNEMRVDKFPLAVTSTTAGAAQQSYVHFVQRDVRVMVSGETFVKPVGRAVVHAVNALPVAQHNALMQEAVQEALSFTCLCRQVVTIACTCDWADVGCSCTPAGPNPNPAGANQEWMVLFTKKDDTIVKVNAMPTINKYGEEPDEEYRFLALPLMP